MAWATIEYMELTRLPDRMGLKWCTEASGAVTEYTDMSLLQVLNELGFYGWELCGQNGGNYFILKRVIQ